jgi:hypothetical protein
MKNTWIKRLRAVLTTHTSLALRDEIADDRLVMEIHKEIMSTGGNIPNADELFLEEFTNLTSEAMTFNYNLFDVKEYTDALNACRPAAEREMAGLLDDLFPNEVKPARNQTIH